MNREKSIIIYFSRADENYAVGYQEKGNTEVLAEYIQEFTGADMVKIEPAVPYAKDYETCLKEAKDRQTTKQAPIKQELGDLSSYDTIYLGSPVYWDLMPQELVTAVQSKDYAGKVIKPFVTHEGSGLAKIPNQIQEVCKNAAVVDAIAIKGSTVQDAKEKIRAWLG